MKKRYYLLILIVSVIFLLAGCSQEDASGNPPIPIPTLHDAVYVYDKENIITEETEEQINKMLEDVERKTSVEFFVVTVDSLLDRTVEIYANELFNKIGIGKKEENNGLLLLIYKDKEDVDESKVRIEVGLGMEGFITDGICGRILDAYFVPYREVNNYDTATNYTTQALTVLIAKEKGVNISGITIDKEETMEVTEELEIPWFWIILIVIILIILDFCFTGGEITWLIVRILASGSSGRSGGGGRSAGGGASR